MLNLTMLSDELTGTVDCVSLACGCKEPVPTMVCADGNVEILPRTKAREIVAVNLSSRTIPGKEAYQRTYDAAVKVRDWPDQLLMKKMDTGFRGNAGYEIEGIFDATGKRLCFIMDHIPMRKTFTLYGHQYAAGQISYLDVLETQRTLFDAQSDYAETLSATMSSYATLYKALGGGIMSPEESAEKSAATQ